MYPLGRVLVRAATDVLRIRSELPRDLRRSATRYFDAAKLIKRKTRQRVHRAIAETLLAGFAFQDGPEHAVTAVAEALEDIVQWWDRAASTVNAFPTGTGHEQLGLLPGVRLLAFDVAIRVGAFLRLCGVERERLMDLAVPAARGRLFIHTVDEELNRHGLKRRSLAAPNAPTRNGWSAWDRGILPRSSNVNDLPNAFAEAHWNGDVAAFRARLRAAVASDEVHAWACRTVNAVYAAGLTRFVLEVSRFVQQMPCPESDETRWRMRLWNLVRTGARAEDAGFVLHALSVFSEPGVRIDAVALRREPALHLVRWAAALAGATATSSDLRRSRITRGARQDRVRFEEAASRALMIKPPGYRLPGVRAPAISSGAATLETRYWAEDLLGASKAQLATAVELCRARPCDPRAALLEARALRLCGHLKTAEARCRALTDARPSWPAPHVELACTAIENGAHASAFEILQHACKLGAHDDEVVFMLAKCAALAGDADSASRILSVFLKRNPMHAPASALMACCASVRGRRRDARRWAKLAAKLGCPEALEVLGAKAESAGKGDEARASDAPEPPPQTSTATRSGAFMFLLTPVEQSESDPGPWVRNWRAQADEP